MSRLPHRRIGRIKRATAFWCPACEKCFMDIALVTVVIALCPASYPGPCDLERGPPAWSMPYLQILGVGCRCVGRGPCRTKSWKRHCSPHLLGALVAHFWVRQVQTKAGTGEQDRACVYFPSKSERERLMALPIKSRQLKCFLTPDRAPQTQRCHFLIERRPSAPCGHTCHFP